MSKVKKVLAAVIAAAMAGTLALGATGCQKVDEQQSAASGATASGTQGKISGDLDVAVFKGGYGDQIWKDVAAKFQEKYPDVKVNITANADIGSVLRPQITKGDVPDFIYLASTNKSGLLQALIADKQLADISDVFDSELKGRLLDGALSGPTITPYGDGKIYSAPLFYSVMGPWYDANLFEKNSWEVPKTWDEAYALADKAKEKGIGLLTYAAANAPTYNESLVWPLIATAGTQEDLQNIFDYKEGAWTSQAVTDALGVYQKIHDKGYLMEGTLGMNHTQSQQEWMQDKALFIPNGAWMQGEMKDVQPTEGFEFAMAATPAIKEGQQQCLWAASEEMYIPAKAKNIDAAKAFMKFLYEEDTIQMMAKTTNAVPPIKGAADFVKDAVDEATYNSLKMADSGEYTLVSGGFANTQQTNITIKDDFFNGLNDIMSGKTTAADLQKKLEGESKELAKIKLAAGETAEAASAAE